MELKTIPLDESSEGEVSVEKNIEEVPMSVLRETQEATSEIEGTESGVEEAVSEVEVADPETEEAVSEVEVADPETEEAVSEAEVADPETEEAVSEVEVADPETEEATSEAEGEILPEEVEKPEGTAWYVIHSYSGYENKVRKNLLQRIESMEMGSEIFTVVVPTEEEVEIKNGHRRTYKRRVFPGYILVEMLLTEQSWYVVRNTPGVTGFVGSGSEPTPLQDEEVDKIIKRMEVDSPKIKVGFREGQTVRITDGPFADFTGIVDELFLDRGKVRVLISMFGRETPIEMDFLQVEKL